MTREHAAGLGFEYAQPVVGLLLFAAVVLLGMALLREINR